MRFMLTGANGQVGWELRRSLQSLGEVVALERSQCDLSKPDKLRDIVLGLKPDVIVNAAAYTAVDKAEEDERLATIINGDAVGVLAESAKSLNALLVHYSTDYVFDGQKRMPYTEEDVPDPINAYGRSKLAGERAIQETGCRHLIFRTSWVYALNGHNFINTIIRLARERDQLNVVSDQIGSPTSAEMVADVSALCLYRLLSGKGVASEVSGIFHLTSSEQTTWHELAVYVITKLRTCGIPIATPEEEIVPILTKEYPLPAKRPLYSKLSTKKIGHTFSMVLPHWKFHVDRYLRQMSPSNKLV